MRPSNSLLWKCALFGFVALLSDSYAVHADESAILPGQSTYDQVQRMRKDANHLVEANATSQTLHKAIDMLDGALAVLDRPQTEELANGSVYLRFRRFDVELDIAQAFALLGDKKAALDHLEAAGRVANVDDKTAQNLIKDRAGLKALESEARFQTFMAQAQAVGRLWRHPDLATTYISTLTVEQRIAGLSLFWSEATYNFVYFDHVPDLDWDKTYLDFLPQVIGAKTTHDYYDVLMRFAPLLRDGHTNIYAPKEIADEFYARPPLRTELIDAKVMVSEVRSQTLEKMRVHVGDEIVSIDGEPVREYAERRVRPYVSSSTPQDAVVRMYTYMLLAGDVTKPVRLTLRDARGRMHAVDISRGHYDDVASSSAPRFRDLGKGVVYLKVDEFENDATVKALDDAWPKISRAKALILDLRDNGGGSSGYGLRILDHLSKSPIPTTASRERDYSPVKRAWSPDMASLDWIALDNPSYSHPQERIFDGRVAVLIGPRTFSAGEDFVASFKLMRRGLLIGEPTAGSTGQPLMFKLPGGGMARICVKRDAFPDGTEFVGKGIAPDIAVKRTVDDLRAGRDRVLMRAKAQLLKSENGKGRKTSSAWGKDDRPYVRFQVRLGLLACCSSQRPQQLLCMS
jgi:C-terminal processing protease CtpA/Prc